MALWRSGATRGDDGRNPRIALLADESRYCPDGLSFSICVVAVSAIASNGAEYPQRLAALVNQYRVSHGLPALTVDTAVAGLAREHSAAMAKAGQLSHDDFPSRVERSGFAMRVENVGWKYRSPDGQFDGWRASPEHNRNMLDPRVDRVGIGIVADYVTLIACGKLQ